MDTLKDRMEELKTFTGWNINKICTVAGVISSAVSQWFGKGSKEIHSIQIEPAILLGMATGFNPLWLSKGKLPKMLQGGTTQPWPFEEVDIARWNALTERQKGQVEKVVNDELFRIESQRLQANGAHYP